MRLAFYRYEHSSQVQGIEFELGHREAWIGRNGLGFGGRNVMFNAHWYDLRHPRERYSIGMSRFAFFWASLCRGLCEFVRG